MSTVHLLHHGPVAELKLDNPEKLNAFTMEMLEALERHVATLEREPSVRAVMLTAAPSRAFCAGADIVAWGALSPRDFARHWVREGHRVFDRLARLSKPTVAAIGGHAFGGGLELAACCDIRVMVPDGTLALPESSIGIVPGWGGTQRLVRLIGEPAVKEMALFGRRLSAERACALGFVTEIAANAEAAARTLADAAAGLSPRAVEVAKYQIHAGAGEDPGALIETLGSAAINATDDRGAGVAAFREKRRAEFSGD